MTPANKPFDADMPETIWAGEYHKNGDEKATDGWNIHHHGTKYIRSDLAVPRADVMKLVEQLEASNKRLREWKRAYGTDPATEIVLMCNRSTLAEFQLKHGG